MRVNVIIPVFNRLEHTRKVLEALRRQTIFDALTIVIVNDGSTDGTAGYLQSQSDVIEIRGDGNLWWGGAVEEGLKHVLPSCQPDDYVLLLNNDTWFDVNYVETLVQTSRENGEAAVGSVIHEEGREPPLVSIGAKVNHCEVRRNRRYDAETRSRCPVDGPAASPASPQANSEGLVAKN
ncbi:glycosyltransferase family 2 protein [Rhizobium johnstonii]